MIPGSRPQTALNAEWYAGGATGAECSGPRSSEPGRPAPPGSSWWGPWLHMRWSGSSLLGDGWRKMKQNWRCQLSRSDTSWHYVDSRKLVRTGIGVFFSKETLIVELQWAYVPDRLTLMGKYFILGGSHLLPPLNIQDHSSQTPTGISYHWRKDFPSYVYISQVLSLTLLGANDFISH